MERVVPNASGARAGGDYFPARAVKLIRSGCTLLDCAATQTTAGAWPLGRIVNIVGDKSVGKTLLAIEAAANFARQYPNGRIRYREAESAFDVDYAATLGLPVDRVDFGPEGIDTVWETVEDIFEDLSAAVKEDREDGVPSLYIVDSLDALSSRSEIGRDLAKGSYGTAKAKILSELFRNLVREFKAAEMCLVFISQIRDKIGVTFGAKYTRAGGRALDFYATHVILLSHISTLTRTVKGVKRAVGVRIKAKFTKNKIALPFRECEFILRFGYGVDDLVANVNWLHEVGKLRRVGLSKKEDIDKYILASEKLTDSDYHKRIADIRKIVAEEWQEVETGFRPKRKKYG